MLSMKGSFQRNTPIEGIQSVASVKELSGESCRNAFCSQGGRPLKLYQ